MKTATPVETVPPLEFERPSGFELPDQDSRAASTVAPAAEDFRTAAKKLADQIRPRKQGGGVLVWEHDGVRSRVNPLDLILRVARNSGFEFTPEEKATCVHVRATWNAADERIYGNTPDVVIARRKAVAADFHAEPLERTLDAELEEAREIRRKAKTVKQQALEAATPVLGLGMVRVGEILVEKAHEVGIHDAQEAEELGLEHTPSPNHLALLVSAAWLCDLLGMGGIDFDLVERLFRNPGERT